MKSCPTCRRTYADDTLNFCRADGAPLSGNSTSLESATRFLRHARISEDLPTYYLQSRAPSIAVLPFVNMSADPENEYFCDGLSEELLNALAKVEGLKVAARTSSFAFKGRELSVGEIGAELNVSTVLEGSVRVSGKRLRITAQLVNVSDGYHLWSERYDRQMEDVFTVQDEITLAIVDALKVELLGTQRSAVLRHYTENTEAYDTYLKGLHHYNKYTYEGWMKAIEYFEKAIEIEPDYAPAYTSLTFCLGFAWFYGLLPAEEAVPKWKAATARALEIDGGMAEAHFTLANIHFFYEWAWEDAEREYLRALEINPNSTDTHQFYGLFLASRGRPDQAVAEGLRAVELDPLSLVANVHLGWIYYHADRLDGALGQARRIMEIEPNFYGGHWLTGSVYAARGMFDEAIGEYKKALALGGNQVILSNLGTLYGVTGKRDEALRVLDRLLEMREQNYVAAINIARVYSGLGEDDPAYEWMEKAYEERNGEMVFLCEEIKGSKGHTMGESIRTDPRLQDLLLRACLTS